MSTIRIRRNSKWVWKVQKAPAVHVCALVVWASGTRVRVRYPCGKETTWDRDIFLEWWEPRPDWWSEKSWDECWARDRSICTPRYDDGGNA